MARDKQHTEHACHNTADKQHREHVTDPNNARPPRRGVIKRTIGGSLSRSWLSPLPRCRRCCVLLLLLLGLPAAAANNRCAVLASAVCRRLRLSFTLCVRTPRALEYVYAQPLSQGVIKRTIGGSLARSWPLPLPHCRRCCVLLLLLLRLSAAANNRCAVVACAV